MNVYTLRRFKSILKMGLGAIPFVIVVQYVETGMVNQGALVIGFSLGVTIGLFELFIFRDRLKHLPFLPHLLIKSVALSMAIYIALLTVYSIDVVIGDLTITEHLERSTSLEMLRIVGYGFLIASIILFFVQLDQLLGPGVLLRYVSGRYHRPRREVRIFIFLDLKDSTRIAEQMKPEKYYTFLNSFFLDMSEPILETDAEIYQYVGDEVILTWELEKGLRRKNCVRVFFEIKDRLVARRHHYQRTYGIVPEFKAGVHFGPVISAQIGGLKRDIVYNGNVLNTTARIQAVCNECGKELLISAALAKELNLGEDAYQVEDLGSVPLKGKHIDTPICAVRRRQAKP